MATYVPDVKTKRWIVLAPARTKRPDTVTEIPKDMVAKKPVDPFAVGNEAMTPPEVLRMGDGEANKPGWRVRVVPNKFPITDTHEVIIHSPHPEHDIEDLETDAVSDILFAYRQRYQTHRNDGQVLIFCNHGEHAGASLKHPHSQLVVIPSQITLDALEQEPINNIVMDNTHFMVYCPEFSQWPYETWIAPKKKETFFGDITDEEVKDLAPILQSTLRRLRDVYHTPDMTKLRANIPFNYNYYIYHWKNWFVRIIPRLVHRAGFELGTGLNVNIIHPKEAAERLGQK